MIQVGLRLVSLKNLPQHKSRNICTKFQAYMLILSIFLLKTLTTVALTLKIAFQANNSQEFSHMPMSIIKISALTSVPYTVNRRKLVNILAKSCKLHT